MSAPDLVIAVPSKGRLQENTFAFFARAGLSIRQPGGERNYRGTIPELPGVEVAFLSASEIAGELARGNVQLGVTGADLIEEGIADPQQKVSLLAPLGFGHANVVVAVPEAWIDVHGMRDLEDVAADFRLHKHRRLLVATKYVALTRRFFKNHNIPDYRIVESAGATEGAPAAGHADIIVDITTTGSTLAANALKVLEDGTILRSEAHLVAALTASWPQAARKLAKHVLGRIHAEEMARTRRTLRLYGAIPDANTLATLAKSGAITLALREDSSEFLVPRDTAATLADACISAGAKQVLIGNPDYVFGRDNPLFEALNARLG